MSDFTELVDLASERLGGRVLEANDDFFAPKSNLLKASKPIFIDGKFTTRGKWMDGWETRRRRTPGHDWCLIRLGLPGILRGVVVDTSFFKGNYPEHFSLEACDLGDGPPYQNEKIRLEAPETPWVEILPKTALKGDSQNMVPVAADRRFTHLRLRIFPDGGIARLRVHGEVVPNKARTSKAEIDLASIQNGGMVISSSDRFFGEPLNLLMPGSARNMGEGWETRRRRGPGHDWVIVKLGVPGTIRRIEVNTAHFKGNYPASCSLEICHAEGAANGAPADDSKSWKELLPATPLKANYAHIFRNLSGAEAATRARFNIYPDGGVARLRLFGTPVRSTDGPEGVQTFNQLPDDRAKALLLDCCGSERWAEQMLAQKPFSGVKDLLAAADRTWAGLGKEDWLEAFRHHPPIGSKKAQKPQSETARKWSTGEQATAQKASTKTLERLAAANKAYEAVFGHVFLICATGKTSRKFSKVWSSACRTIARRNCAPQPKSTAKSRAYAWRNSSDHEPNNDARAGRIARKTGGGHSGDPRNGNGRR
jgi:allantoicase